MIVVNIEMWPRGDESKKYSIGKMFIWNRGNIKLHQETNGTRGDYEFELLRRDKVDVPHNETETKDITARGRIENWPKRSYTIWKLIKRCLEVARI